MQSFIFSHINIVNNIGNHIINSSTNQINMKSYFLQLKPADDEMRPQLYCMFYLILSQASKLQNKNAKANGKCKCK